LKLAISGKTWIRLFLEIYLIASKAKAFARKHKDLINPIIGGVRAGAKAGIPLDSRNQKSCKKTHRQMLHDLGAARTQLKIITCCMTAESEGRDFKPALKASELS
jgi:hypothetical protein